MQLNPLLLNDAELDDAQAPIESNSTVKGLYNHIVYVLRLHPEVHDILYKVDEGKTDDLIPGEIHQALSTLFHETLHWWQFIGSTSGLIMSLSMPAQTMANLNLLKEYVNLSGKKKPISIYSENNLEKSNSNTPEFRVINQIMNNYHDINYYKIRMKRPSYMGKVCNDTYFESIGHSYSIAYGSAISVLASTFDNNFSFLPNIDEWEEKFTELAAKKVSGFYHGEDIGIPPVGLSDLYEGQARFNQLLYLHITSEKQLDWYQFKGAGMLHGIYISAFEVFLKIIEEEYPKSIDSPLVALYLLLIDVAINPAEGFPSAIERFEYFIEHTDPGIRFIHLCAVVKNQYPEFKYIIDDYTPEQYWVVSTILCKAIGVISPIKYLCELDVWRENEESLIELMQQNERFSFEKGNLLVRLLFARFLSFNGDKLSTPEFFCWPGVYVTGGRSKDIHSHLYKKHQALFKENINMDIAPSKLPGIDEKTLSNTAGDFYLAVALFNLCQQWISEPGGFKYNFGWLTKEHSSKELEDWAKNAFIQVFGFSPEDFDIVIPNTAP
ncbi:hypothetical protein QM543_10190 [Pantoea eucrina]|uniref:hypothetical protein n=1 Tax=Pantoea eucrina TaxID=472693 RepID=UPI0024B7733F|nr:hypothetical protein [Pantoea eucrina]MDJ0023654.1 hypothetical protein [Pantoea eucrina]